MTGGKLTGMNELKKLQAELKKLDDQKDEFMRSCAKELAARLLAKVVRRTPVGDYNTYWTDKDGTRILDLKDNKPVILKKSDKKGGTLRRGWTAGNRENAVQFAKSLPVHHFGGNYVIEIENSVFYAIYVEYGHRTKSGSWVPGKFMMTISEQELEKIAPALLEKRIAGFLKERLND
jgi:hypothetical protein